MSCVIERLNWCHGNCPDCPYKADAEKKAGFPKDKKPEVKLGFVVADMQKEKRFQNTPVQLRRLK